MDSASVRQSFLDFFASKNHRVVSSASLLPTAPNLLFTNAGMNQFVPCFLGEREAPASRVADTQKCIRAGGKHNDLEDVGFDAYHQTFFEMLGNWSFGDYFKKEALSWSWELLTEVWKMPAERLYATVYQPGDGDPAEFDSEAYAIWKAIFEKAGLDPSKHIVTGGKKDNFWMMGDTGPCGPCSEIHMDLTPENGGDKVNAGSPWCIEIWNNVFIQFNACEDGSMVPLKHKHVDTGMGFERVAGIFATTKGFTEFKCPPSNYNADIFTPFFSLLCQLSGHIYAGTLPVDPEHLTSVELKDVAFRVLADHARCLCCAVADGILPGNEGRNYVLRRILRRAVLWGRRLNLEAGSFVKLVDPVLQTLGAVFPELMERQELLRKVLASEEAAFERTLDRGLAEFEKVAASGAIGGLEAFTLYDTYGFPLDLTQLLARERGLSVDEAGFHGHMDHQRAQSRAAQKKSVVAVRSGDGAQATLFVGFDPDNWVDFSARLASVRAGEGFCDLVFAETPFYGEKGGQVGDSGTVSVSGRNIPVETTWIDADGVYLHRVRESVSEALVGSECRLSIDVNRRKAIQRHHSATHLLHWALRKVVGSHVRQAGSLVTPERLRFDFSHFEKVSPDQLATIERMVNGKILENDPVVTFETPFDQKPADVMAFFEDKYGDVVRVVDIGGYSKELCGGTHVQQAAEIGFLKIVQESSIAAGSRRIEAIAGEAFGSWLDGLLHQVDDASSALGVTVAELGRRSHELVDHKRQLEKELADLKRKEGMKDLAGLLASAVVVGGYPRVVAQVECGNPNELRGMAAHMVKQMDNGVVVLGAEMGDKVSVVVLCSDAAVAGGCHAGTLLNRVVGVLGGKGGGKPDFAMGGARNDGRLKDALAVVRTE
ncbi:MAG: alanine--tRNA ligase [Opitutales bacterium]|nr:alanine--tRNA ligase [Opitutales bacterium]